MTVAGTPEVHAHMHLENTFTPKCLVLILLGELALK
jgi:hypothetical protein